MSSHPDDRVPGDPVIPPDPTQPQGAQPVDASAAAGTGPHDDPAGWGAADARQDTSEPRAWPRREEPDPRQPTAPLAQSELDRATRPDQTGARPDHDRVHDGHGRADDRSPVDDAVQSLSQPDNRARLLLAIAVMTGLTLLLTLGLLIDRLAEDDGTEPVLVEGVPCLVEEGPEEDTRVLYCQR